MDDEEEKPNLNTEEREHIELFLLHVERLGDRIKEPMDPKIELGLELVYALLKEQLVLDKKYEWREPAKEGDKFVDDTNAISAEDFKEMMGEDYEQP